MEGSLHSELLILALDRLALLAPFERLEGLSQVAVGEVVGRLLLQEAVRVDFCLFADPADAL